MLVVKKILHDIYGLLRCKDRDGLISIYEECKNNILEIEKIEGIAGKNSYFSQETQLRKQIEKEYQEMVIVKDKENNVLKDQIKALKTLENQFKEVNKSLKEMQKITKDKDLKIKNLENKIKEAEALAADS